MIPAFTLCANGDAAMDIRFDAEPGELLSGIIIGLQNTAQLAMQYGDWPELQELIPAYQCLTVCFDPLQVASAGEHSLRERLQAFVTETVSSAAFQDSLAHSRNSKVVEIPVCYADAYAPDMVSVCTHTGLSQREVINLHSAPDYLVHMLGFSPGFLYLGGVNAKLHCPRKDNPALRVAAGAVGIGGAQTGIYPQATPGGWQIIGRTPLKLFDPTRTFPFIARPLDHIRFVPISSIEFEEWQR